MSKENNEPNEEKYLDEEISQERIKEAISYLAEILADGFLAEQARNNPDKENTDTFIFNNVKPKKRKKS